MRRVNVRYHTRRTRKGMVRVRQHNRRIKNYESTIRLSKRLDNEDYSLFTYPTLPNDIFIGKYWEDFVPTEKNIKILSAGLGHEELHNLLQKIRGKQASKALDAITVPYTSEEIINENDLPEKHLGFYNPSHLGITFPSDVPLKYSSTSLGQILVKEIQDKVRHERAMLERAGYPEVQENRNFKSELHKSIENKKAETGFRKLMKNDKH